MRFTRTNEVKLYGHDAEEEYVFSFTDGELDSLELSVRIDKRNEGYLTDYVIQEKDISIEEVPRSIRDDVYEMLSTAASEI